jgi:hypothetical protein
MNTNKVALLILIFLFNFTGHLYCQIDTINESYFKNLQKDLLTDPTVKDVKYVCERYNGTSIKTQHIYVMYKTDTIVGYWRVGKCFHYYPNGNLELFSNINLVTKKYDGITAGLGLNGDTLEVTIWGNYKNRMIPPNVVYKIDSIGQIHELHSDELTNIKYKKGKRKSAETSVFLGDYMTKLREVSYNKDGSVDKVKDYSEQVSKLEKKVKK